MGAVVAAQQHLEKAWVVVGVAQSLRAWGAEAEVRLYLALVVVEARRSWAWVEGAARRYLAWEGVGESIFLASVVERVRHL